MLSAGQTADFTVPLQYGRNLECNRVVPSLCMWAISMAIPILIPVLSSCFCFYICHCRQNCVCFNHDDGLSSNALRVLLKLV